MNIDSIIKTINNISQKDNIEFIIDYLICELESDRHSYEIINDSISAIELSIESMGGMDQIVLNNPYLVKSFDLCKHNMNDLLESVEYMMSLCDIIIETYSLSEEGDLIKGKVNELYKGNCEIYSKCKKCQNRLEEILS